MCKQVRIDPPDGLVVGNLADMMANDGTYVNYWGDVPPGSFDRAAIPRARTTESIETSGRQIHNSF